MILGINTAIENLYLPLFMIGLFFSIFIVYFFSLIPKIVDKEKLGLAYGFVNNIKFYNFFFKTIYL